MMFSVCIPVYNTSEYLRECLDSVLSQTFRDFEIVLIDDGSTDDSPRICDEYAEEHSNIRVIHKQNEGLMMTRRRGFQEARGDYFICLDSDDALNDVDGLKKIRHMIEEKNADMVIYEYFYAFERTVGAGKRISLFDHPSGYIFQGEQKQELYNKFLLGKGLNPIVIKAVSRKIVDMDEDYSRWKDSLVNGLAEDLFQTLPILDAAQRVAYLKESLYFYRWNPASISRNIRPDYYYAYRTVYQRTDEYLKKWGFEEEKIHRIMQGRINMIFGVLLAEHQPDRKRWLQVLSEVSDDPFFRELWQKRDKAYICKYYMLMGQLILKKQFLILQIVKKTVEFLVRIKKYIQRSN
ncbi:MAG: glycosyltransferase family 2 protein [Ruminococcaceae bacterium]|nr:glycosyltransferase family 2 protein [Oscillospiraceae bacterium]